MSNKQVPAVYRTIINDVIENVRAEFDEVGVEDVVLQELLRSWETKVAQSRVADFSNDPAMAPIAKNFPPIPHVQGAGLNGAAAAAAASMAAAAGAKVKKEAGVKKEEGEDKPKLDDDDEINSDLDDPDEEVDAEDEEAGADSGDIVIALYEKVQRVKNKWKVTLKDGLVSVGGKDYLFAKCSGEFEW